LSPATHIAILITLFFFFALFTFPGRGIVCKTTTIMNFPTH